MKPCILVVDILKMCTWLFGGARINFDRMKALILHIYIFFFHEFVAQQQGQITSDDKIF